MNRTTMPADVALRCTCGALRGAVHGIAPEQASHGVCYCDDCQAFVRHLGRAADVLDAYGGTEIMQVSPARVAVTAGAERLACLRLTEKGLLRWYAACCRTPIGNTLATWQVPFVGLIAACLDRDANDAAAVAAAFGPIRFKVFARYANGRPPDSHDGAPFAAVPRVARIVLGARLRGEHKRTPFFDPVTHAPVVTPHVLTPDERRALGRG